MYAWIYAAVVAFIAVGSTYAQDVEICKELRGGELCFVAFGNVTGTIPMTVGIALPEPGTKAAANGELLGLIRVPKTAGYAAFTLDGSSSPTSLATPTNGSAASIQLTTGSGTISELDTDLSKHPKFSVSASANETFSVSKNESTIVFFCTNCTDTNVGSIFSSGVTSTVLTVIQGNFPPDNTIDDNGIIVYDLVLSIQEQFLVNVAAARFANFASMVAAAGF